MALFLSYVALGVGLGVATVFLRFAYAIWALPEHKRRQLRERHFQRKRTNMMIALLHGKQKLP